MKSSDSQQLIDKIEGAIERTKALYLIIPPRSQAEANSFFAQFLVVYICGLYEEIIETTIIEMVHRLGNEEVESYIKSSLSSYFRNPDISKILELFSKFNNKTWIDALKSLPKKNKSALDSIVINKNSLAHGQSALSLTISDVEDYYRDSKIIIDKIDELLL